MGICFRDLKIPTGCCDCTWRDPEFGGACGLMPNTAFKTYDAQYAVCPWRSIVRLYPPVTVPPHGRLIDVDAMEHLMSDTVQGDIRGYPYSDTLWDTAFRWLDNQPTVLPAEEGE